MKKLLTITFALCSALMAMACSSNDPEESNVPESTEQNGEEAAKGKMLVIYFSRAGENWQVGNVERGNTAIMVDYIQEYADVDVFEIVPEVAYPSNYMECVNYVNDIEIPQNLRPTCKGDISNIADYGTVLIGGPIWCGQPSYIFRTFFEKHPELGDKTIIPFGTHGGSGVGSYASVIKEYYPNANVLESLGISGSSIRNASAKTTPDGLPERAVSESRDSQERRYDRRDPYHQSRSVKAHIAKLGTILEAWFPLGGRGTGIKTLSEHEVITSIAQAHGKSAYQVLLRWHLQCGTIAIPGSSNAAHIAEDYDIFDFELTPDEMQRINALECNHRFASY